MSMEAEKDLLAIIDGYRALVEKLRGAVEFQRTLIADQQAELDRLKKLAICAK